MKTNHFNYKDLIKKYMLKIVSFCAFLDIIDKKCVFYMENNQKNLNHSAQKYWQWGRTQRWEAVGGFEENLALEKQTADRFRLLFGERNGRGEYSQNKWIQREN